MKLLTDKQLEDANDVFLYHGFKGAAVMFVTSGAALFLLGRYTKATKRLTIPLKAFFVSSATTVGFVINGEHALIEYDRKQYSHLKSDLISSQPQTTEESEEPFSIQAMNLVSKYKFQILFSSWVIGMGATGFYLNSKKYLTTSQKLVEARMYAQAITLASLAAVAAISAGAPNDPKNRRQH